MGCLTAQNSWGSALRKKMWVKTNSLTHPERYRVDPHFGACGDDSGEVRNAHKKKCLASWVADEALGVAQSALQRKFSARLIPNGRWVVN